MKKILLPVLLLGLIFTSTNTMNAQHLPSGDDKTFEVMVSPFSANPISFEQFRIRFFQSADMAFRVRGMIDYNTDRSSADDWDSQFGLSIAPGVEWHAFQYNRLSMYYGAELPISYATSRIHSEDRTDKNLLGGEHFGIGINALAGLDVHFLQRLYTGMEIGYGFQVRSTLDAELDGNTIERDGRRVELGSFFYPRLRLGVRF